MDLLCVGWFLGLCWSGGGWVLVRLGVYRFDWVGVAHRSVGMVWRWKVFDKVGCLRFGLVAAAQGSVGLVGSDGLVGLHFG